MTTLDPESWEQFRRFAHQVLDDSVDFLATVRDRPAWQPVPDGVRARFTSAVPRQGQGLEAAYRDYLELVQLHASGNIHPRWWGWVDGTGSPLGLVTEMLAATLNVNARGHEHPATYVELQVLDWLKEMFEFPAQASGMLVSGGSEANLVGLAVARNARAPFRVRWSGLSSRPRLMAYTSLEAHSSVQRALELMGLGSESLAYIATDGDYRIDVEALRLRVWEDRGVGYLPFCVIATAGTVNTGAVDPLGVLADFCREEKLWLHVDGAFGALAALDPARKELLQDMSRADSLAFDLHKWLHMPYDVACILVRDGKAHRQAFELPAAYLQALPGSVADGPAAFADFGPQLSRGFRALKVWMSLKAYGLETFASLIARNIHQAQYLAFRIRGHPRLELLAPVPLNVVNFRYFAAELEPEKLNEINSRILLMVQQRGIAVPSSTLLHGRFAIRVAVTNHRSTLEDFDALIAAVADFGDALVSNG
jgi:aromatic-L-amino-acid decarboxylase